MTTYKKMADKEMNQVESKETGVIKHENLIKMKIVTIMNVIVKEQNKPLPNISKVSLMKCTYVLTAFQF